MIEIIPYVVLFMIAYDLSIHFVYFFKWDKLIIKRKLNWWFNYWGIKYQLFWIIYWSIALLFLLAYIISSS